MIIELFGCGLAHIRHILLDLLPEYHYSRTLRQQMDVRCRRPIHRSIAGDGGSFRIGVADIETTRVTATVIDTRILIRGLLRSISN